MPSDVKIIQDPDTNNWDIDFENGDFALTDGLDSALYLSVLGEQRATPEEISNPIYRRGHFTNVFQENPFYEVGSKLWLTLNQRIVSSALFPDIEQNIRDGVRWMIDDAVIEDVQVELSIADRVLEVNIGLISLDKSDSQYITLFINTFE